MSDAAQTKESTASFPGFFDVSAAWHKAAENVEKFNRLTTTDAKISTNAVLAMASWPQASSAATSFNAAIPRASWSSLTAKDSRKFVARCENELPGTTRILRARAVSMKSPSGTPCGTLGNA